MDKWLVWTEEQEAEWKDWLEGRPASVKDVIAKYNLRPDTAYRLKPTGQIGQLFSFSEDGTVTVIFRDNFFGWAVPTQVFGIDPADLEECEVPEEPDVRIHGEHNPS